MSYFKVLRKHITKQDDIPTFRASSAHAKIKTYVDACCTAVRHHPRSSVPTVAPSPAESFFASIDALFTAIQEAVNRIPLRDMKAQRFGNKAFTDYHNWLVEEGPALVKCIVGTLPSSTSDATSPGAPSSSPTTEQQENADVPNTTTAKESQIVDELCDYLYDSFGNPTRLDYGTGHELHMFCFLMVLMDHWDLHRRDETFQQHFLALIVFRSFGKYMETMRTIQRHYSLEPAGSHGVWGLDDYHHLPFIFGAAQLTGYEKETPNPILPKHVVDKHHVEEHRREFFYFESIAWIFENKNGPFHEHSNVLYGVSGLDEWGRITLGMIKMYDGEVLGKFNVIQHFLFGQHFEIASIKQQ